MESPPPSPGSLLGPNCVPLPDGVLPFVRKAYEILSDPNVGHIIAWSPSGSSFVVHDTTEFSDRVLPRYFKHRNFCSFVRQLNTYGFAKADTKTWEFQHELFRRDAPESLVLIKRRKPAKRPAESSPSPSRESSPVCTTTLPSISSSEGALLVAEINRLRASASASASAARSAQASADAANARADAALASLGRYQALCSSIVSQVSSNAVRFPSVEAEKAFLSSLCSVLLSEPDSKTPSPTSPGSPVLSPDSSTPALSPSSGSPARGGSPGPGFVPSSPECLLDFGSPPPALFETESPAASDYKLLFDGGLLEFESNGSVW